MFLFDKIRELKRRASSLDKAIDILVILIVMAIAVYIEAASLPGALAALATTALTSVSAAIATLFQTVTSIVVVSTTILLFVGIIRHILTH